jgi:hypothetical protein
MPCVSAPTSPHLELYTSPALRYVYFSYTQCSEPSLQAPIYPFWDLSQEASLPWSVKGDVVFKTQILYALYNKFGTQTLGDTKILSNQVPVHTNPTQTIEYLNI